MFWHALVEITRHLPKFHEGALHVAQTFDDVFGRLELKLAIQFLFALGVGKYSPGLVCAPSTGDFGAQSGNLHNGEIELRVAVQGSGPLIVCVHGWPELWYSWRHQMQYFADRGYRVAAMDVRGYGGSSKPHDVSAYTITELAGDVAAVITSLSPDGTAIVFGHDWGAPIAWNTARLHPAKVSAVAGLSVPYFPVGKFFYQVYFQNEGVAEAEFEADSLRAIRMIYFAGSGDATGAMFLQDKPQLGSLPNPNLTQPAAFIGGEHDMVRHFMDGVDTYEMASLACDDFRGTTIIEGAGHWVQQEAPQATNEALEAFLAGLD
ncbi:Epoxide hydrolase A [Nymphon striatum]|nr:Epoxide hydrolase A [Nymphon striatum]